MEDTVITGEMTTLLISTKDGLEEVCEKIKTAFDRYDRAEGIALDHRKEYGWGIYGFVRYLVDEYEEWVINNDNPDAILELIGM